MVEATLKIKIKKATYLTETFAWDYTIYDFGTLSCYNLGLSQKAFEFAKIAAALAPYDKRIKNNLKIIEQVCVSKKYD